MNNKYRIILIIGGFLLILSIAGAILFWWPTVLTYTELKSQLEAKDSELKEKQEYFAKLNSMSDKIKDYEEQMSKIGSAFPDDWDIALPTLFNFMTIKTSGSGLMLESISGGEKSSKANDIGLEEMPFQVSLKGTYPTFKNFISSLLKNVRIFDVNSIQFGSPEESNFYVFSVSLKTYLKSTLPAETALPAVMPE